MSRRRSRRKGKRTTRAKKERRWLRDDARLVLLAATVLGLAAALVQGFREDVWISLPVCYVWFTGILFVFLLRLFALGRFMVPDTVHHKPADAATDLPRGLPAAREGTLLLVQHNLQELLPAGLRNQFGFTPGSAPAELPDSFKSYRAGLLPSHLAAVIGRGNTVTRAAGPGYVRLEKGERILRTVDLRLQYRQKKIEATTRDGIPLKSTVSALYHLRRPPGEELASGKVPYPYSPDTVYRLLPAGSTNTDGEEVAWSARICPEIEAIVVSEVSKYTLDQLYRPPANGSSELSPLEKIRETLRQELPERLSRTFGFDETNPDQENPLTIVSAGFGYLQPPSEIEEQRIKSWQASWEQRQKRHRAESQAELIRTVETARARAELAIIQEVTETIRTVHQATGVELDKLITLRLLESLDRLVDDHLASPPAVASQPAPDKKQVTKLFEELSDQLRLLNAGDET